MNSTSNKKRKSSEELLDGVDGGKVALLEKEVKELKEENKWLKAKLQEYENNESSDDDDEDDDEDSVCDGTPFSVKYHLLKQYKQENGNCMVPQKHKALGMWVNNTRKTYAKKKMPQERIDKLNKIGFYWGKGHPLPPTWDDRFAELEAYHGNFGHCNIHVDSNPKLMTDLAKWAVEQRKQGKRLQKMKPSSMTMEQYKRLDSLSFKWKVPKKTTRK